MNIHNPNSNKTLVPASTGVWPKGLVAGVIRKSLDTYIILPAFNLSRDLIDSDNPGLHFDSSFCVAQYNYSVARNISFKQHPIQVPPGVTYCLIVRYFQGGNSFRFKLWSDVGESLVFFPNYSGQVIPGNFSLEVWCFPTSFTCVNPAAVALQLSIMATPARGSTDLSPINYPTSSQILIGDANFFCGGNFPEQCNPIVAFVTN